MSETNNLTYSEKKTKLTIYKIIGRKISEARKSSRRKLDGISKKLNINKEILKKIESGNVENIEKEIPVNGFIRAYAKFTNTDISDEIERLQSDYFIQEKPKNIYKGMPSTKMSKIFSVFLVSFCFLLVVIYLLGNNKKVEKKTISENKEYTEREYFSDKDLKKGYQQENKTIDTTENTNNLEATTKDDKSFFEIIFLEDTWIEVYGDDNIKLESGIYKIGDSLNFKFESDNSDFFIKSGNLGGFQIFFKDEFFAPFGYSGQVHNGFYLLEKILEVKNRRL